MIAILDANALLIPWNFRVDVFEELSRLGFVPSTIEPVRRELNSLMKKALPGQGWRCAFQLDVRPSKLNAVRPLTAKYLTLLLSTRQQL